MVYEHTSRIRYSEMDGKGKLKPEKLADYYQDCAIFHDQDAGMGTEYWLRRGAMWVLTSWKVLIFGRPSVCDTVTVGTTASGFRRATGYRNFAMRSAEGKLLNAAFSKWALLDIATGMPAIIRPEEAAAYGTGEPLPIEEEKGQIVIPEDAEEKEPFPVMKHNLDANGHVNNAEFIRMAIDYVPRSLPIRSMRVSYHRPALLGELLCPVFAFDGHTVTGVIRKEDGTDCAYFRFSDILTEADERVALL